MAGRLLRSTASLRALWGPACSPGRMVRLPLWCCSGASITVDSRTVAAWRTFDAIAKKHNYRFRPADTGAYVCRAITGGSGYSLHAYGIAADFNWQSNPYFPYPVSQAGHCDIPNAMLADIRAVQTNNGAWVFDWGGDWSSIKDFMHFQISASPAELATGIKASGPTMLTQQEKLYWWLWAGEQAKKKPFLEVGSESNPRNVEHIKVAQKALGLPQTGTFGAGTYEKVKAFQTFLKFKPRRGYGKINRKTWQWLIYHTYTKGRV